MSKTLTDAILVIRNTLSASQTLDSWARANFSVPVKIYLGVDPLDLPEMQVSSPIIAVVPGRRRRLSEQTDRSHEIRVRCVINHAEKPDIVGNVVSWPGLALIDTFANLVESEIVSAFNAAGIASTQEPEEGDETIPPFFIARWTFNVLCPTRP